MSTENKLPQSFQEAAVYFADPDNAHRFATMLRWPDGVECPRCGSKEHSFVSTRRLWFCKGCKKQFTVKVGSIFEDSPLGMDKWMLAVWLMVNCKNGISSYEVASHLKITQKSAWHVMHRVRRALQAGSFFKLGGPGTEVEVDETLIGAKARNMHKDVRAKRLGYGDRSFGKVIVMGLLERKGKVKVGVVPETSRHTLQGAVRRHVEPGTDLYTDEHVSYQGLDSEYAHKVINHAEKYVDGRVHTNSLENFWSLLKRCIGGTYVSVEPFHLFRYLDEQSYRYNNRTNTPAERFMSAMANVSGKRLTWEQVTGHSEGEIRSHSN